MAGSSKRCWRQFNQVKRLFNYQKTLNPPYSPPYTVLTSKSPHSAANCPEHAQGLNEIKAHSALVSSWDLKTQGYSRFNAGSFILVATACVQHAGKLFQSLAASNFEPVSKLRCTMNLPSSGTPQILHQNVQSVASGFNSSTISTGLHGATEQTFAWVLYINTHTHTHTHTLEW